MKTYLSMINEEKLKKVVASAAVILTSVIDLVSTMDDSI